MQVRRFNSLCANPCHGTDTHTAFTGCSLDRTSSAGLGSERRASCEELCEYTRPTASGQDSRRTHCLAAEQRNNFLESSSTPFHLSCPPCCVQTLKGIHGAAGSEELGSAVHLVP
eukprot:scpid31299/ scgid28963/ 